MGRIVGLQRRIEPLARRRRSGRVSLPLAVGLALAGVGVLVLAAWVVARLFGGGAATPVAEDRRADEPPALPSFRLESPVKEAAAPEPVPLKDALAALEAAVASKAASLDDPAIEELVRLGGQTGRRRADVPPPLPCRHAWEIRLVRGSSVESYARQLDALGIELGMVLPEGKLVYVSDLSKPKPPTRSGVAGAEGRYYFTSSDGSMVQADQEILARAGLAARDRVVLKLLPAEREEQLAELEKAHAGDKADRVSKTCFGIRAEGDGYAFYVLDQWYR